MSSQMPGNNDRETYRRRRGRFIPGAILIAVGLVALAGETIRSEWLGLLLVPALGFIFLAAGVLSRRTGFLIPGGILSGVGLGAIVERLTPALSGEAKGGVVLLCMALGFAVITPLTAICCGGVRWWPLVVAVIMALVGGALWVGGPALGLLTLAGQAWPLALIALGVYILWQRRDMGAPGGGGPR